MGSNRRQRYCRSTWYAALVVEGGLSERTGIVALVIDEEPRMALDLGEWQTISGVSDKKTGDEILRVCRIKRWVRDLTRENQVVQFVSLLFAEREAPHKQSI
jgi:hypothetical protein